MSAYTGTMIADLINSVDRTMQRTGDPLIDLAKTKEILADRRPMSAFDEAKWWKADRLQEAVLSGAPISPTCIACIGDNDTGEFGHECGKPSVGDTEFCERHLAESGL